MRQPMMASTIERRFLLNYAVDPDVVAGLLPVGLRPRLQGGVAVAGVCLIRLGAIRPAIVTRSIGLRTENAAHRIAVDWDTVDGAAHGVYVPMRVSGSRVTAWAGGRLFPGVHRLVEVESSDRGAHHEVRLRTSSGDFDIAAEVTDSDRFRSAVFDDLAEASAFFESGPVGWSPGLGGEFDGMRLDVDRWSVRPLDIDYLASSWFDDPCHFPPGSIRLDCGLTMEPARARWTGVDGQPRSDGGSTSSPMSSAAGASRCIS